MVALKKTALVMLNFERRDKSDWGYESKPKNSAQIATVISLGGLLFYNLRHMDPE